MKCIMFESAVKENNIVSSKYLWICYPHQKLVEILLEWQLMVLQTLSKWVASVSACVHWGSAAHTEGKRGSPEPCVYTVCFLYGCFGACKGKDTAVRDLLNINTEQWMMNGGGFAPNTPFWGICVGAIQGQLNRTQCQSCPTVLHTNYYLRVFHKTLSKWTLPFPGEL